MQEKNKKKKIVSKSYVSKSILDTEKIAVRAGHHCAQPLGAYLNLPATARASLYFYNTEEEVNLFLEKVAKVRSWMGFKED